MSQNKEQRNAEIKKQIMANKHKKALNLQHFITVVSLLIVLVIGLISTTFSAFVADSIGEGGSLVASIQTAAVNQGNKDHVANTGANVNLAQTGITYESGDVLFYNIKGESWWTNDNAKHAVYFFNSSNNANAWSSFAVQYSGDIYYVTIPAGTWDKCIIARLNSSVSSPTWNAWNQTGNITLSSTQNYISDFANTSDTVTWSTQKSTSTATLSASSTNVKAGTNVTLTAGISGNTTFNEKNSVSYSISPSSGATITGDTFNATTPGTYTVTATVTYNPKGYSTLTSTASKSVSIVVSSAVETVDFSVTQSGGTGTVKINNVEITEASGSALVEKGTSPSVSITAPSGYYIKSVSGVSVTPALGTEETTYSGTTSAAISANANMTVTYEEVPPITVYVGIISYISNTSDFALHYWNDSGLAGDATLTSANTTASYALGSAYWGNAVQTFNVFTAQVNSSATAMKTFNKTGNSNWANEQIAVSDYNGSKIILLYEWGGIHHNVLEDMPTHTITWNYLTSLGVDASTTTQVMHGDVPTPPTIDEGTTSTGYTFTGWPTISAATEDATYTANYSYTSYAQNDVVYFDCLSAPSLANTDIYVQCDNDTVSGGTRYKMTKIGTYLYMYKFTASPSSGVLRFWSGDYYSAMLPKSTLTTYNGIASTSTAENNTGTKQKFVIGSVSAPTLTVSPTSVQKGSSVTLTSTEAVLSYTRGGFTYTTTPTGAVYTYRNGTTALSSTTATTYSWTPTSCGTHSVTVQVSSTTAGAVSATSAAKTVTVYPAPPTALTLSGLNVAPGTSGTGTASNPFIVFENGGFTLTASATVVSPAIAHYSATANGTYTTTNTFSPALTTKGTGLSYTVYAKAYEGGLYSLSYKDATAHYMVFSHLSKDNTGFTISDSDITVEQSVTLSDAYVNGVATAEKTYIEQTYQVSTDNSTFTDLVSASDSYVWTPPTDENNTTYYFRVKTYNEKTLETVYSDAKLVTVDRVVYRNITVVNEGTIDGTVTLKSNGTTITNNRVLLNEPLSISLTRPNSNYYIDYLDVDGVIDQGNDIVNGDISDYIAYNSVTDNVTISYKIVEKPKVTVYKPANSASIGFKYYVDGTLTTKAAAGTYYVDYNGKIEYSVTPNSGYYVTSMTGVTIGTKTASTVTGSKSNVTSNITNVTATLTKNNTVTVNLADTTDAHMTVGGTAASFNTAIPLNYGTPTEIVITPPDGYYAQVTGNSVSPTIDPSGKATFSVTLTGSDKEYDVSFAQNPKIYMVQPEYGSIYINDNFGNYYFNGDSVGYGTELTVNVKKDHANASLNVVYINDSAIGTTDGATFNITADSTASADISVSSNFAFASNEHTAYGTRRIFFTDTAAWGSVNVFYSNKQGDSNFTGTNKVAMTYKYTNDVGTGQKVYYADIPFSSKYVTFVNASNTAQYSSQGTVVNTSNAFYMVDGTAYPRALGTWQYVYSDYIATDRVDTIQQASTSKGNAVEFMYSCDYGDGALVYELISGDAVLCEFDSGKLFITPTANANGYSLVKVQSTASTTVKYYLIRVESFEIYDFNGLQKIYKANVLNNIQLNLIVKGGVLDYAAKYFVSDTNVPGTFTTELNGTSTGFGYDETIEGYINNFLISYTANGVKFFKAEATDGSGKKVSTTMKTLFGTNTYEGERTLYFYNGTNVDLSKKYKLRACFIDENNINKTFVTMQQVGDTDYYRAVIPKGVESKVNFYLCNPKTFSNNYADFDGTDDTTDFYSFGLFNVDVPNAQVSNIVFNVTAIDTTNGIVGEFVDFS